jgi:hypothetical protein
LAAPLGIETLSLDVKLANLERKKTYLEKLLAQLQREHASVAFPVPQLPIRDLLHAAGASSVVHAPPHNAAQASAALFLASGLGHPPMPDNFSYYYDVADRGKRSRSPKNTDRTFFCNCAFEEGVASASAPVAEPVAAEQAAAPADAASPASEGGATPAAEDCYWASDSRDAATGAAAPADTSHHISRSFFRLQSCSPNSEQLCNLLSNLKCGATMGLESCITFLGIVSFARWHVENPLAINSKSKLSGNKYRIRLLLERKRQYDKS